MRKLLQNAVILLRMLITEREVLQFGLNFIQAQAVGQRSEDIECLAGNFVLLTGKHACECSHVVQSVGNFDEYDTNVIAHGEEEFFESFRLQRCTVAEDATRNLCQPLDDVGHFRSEEVGKILIGVVCIFLHVMQKGCTDGGRPQSDFLARDLCHGNGVQDVGLS